MAMTPLTDKLPVEELDLDYDLFDMFPPAP
jgi:hypothetical protein